MREITVTLDFVTNDFMVARDPETYGLICGLVGMVARKLKAQRWYDVSYRVTTFTSTITLKLDAETDPKEVETFMEELAEMGMGASATISLLEGESANYEEGVN